MRKKEISMIILAGGASSRMGRDKSDLTIDGKTFLEMQIEKGEKLGISDILLSGYHGENKYKYPIIPDHLINCFFQFRICAAAAHKPPQVCTFLILEASFHESFGCKTYSVALTAEFVSHGTYKSDFSLKSCDFIVMAWTVSITFLHCMHGTVGFFQYCFDRFFILEWELFSKSDWHHLDKTHMDWIFLRQSCNPDEVFFFLDHRNAVDLQGKSRMCKSCKTDQGDPGN